MASPLSNDLRERVVQAIASGESCRSAAARFGVSVSSAVKLSQRYRPTGSVTPDKMGGHRKRVPEPYQAFIAERIAQIPHLSLHGLKAELAARGVQVSHDTVWRLLRAEGFLPPYSPDLNPIELAFAKIKRWMRDAQKRTIDDTWRHIGNLIAKFEPDECTNYIANAG